MSLVRLVYCSTATSAVNPESVCEIYQVARENNAAHALTGMLCFDTKYFLQVIEGDRLILNTLYKKIAVDKRHEHLVILQYCDICTRDFYDWNMGYVSLQDQRQSLLLQFGASKDFNPYDMAAASAYNFMLELRSTTSSRHN